MSDLFDDIPIDQVSISLTINHPAIVLLSFLLAHAEKVGVPWDTLRGHRAERLPQGVPRAEDVRPAPARARTA